MRTAEDRERLAANLVRVNARLPGDALGTAPGRGVSGGLAGSPARLTGLIAATQAIRELYARAVASGEKERRGQEESPHS